MANQERKTPAEVADKPPAWALRVAQDLERRRIPHGPDDYRTPEQIEEAARSIAEVAGEGEPETVRSELRDEIEAVRRAVAALAIDVTSLGRRLRRLEVDPNA